MIGQKGGSISIIREMGKAKLRHRRLTVGITGAIASGKSTATKFFKKLGWQTLSADDIVAGIYEAKKLTKEKVLRKFGTSAEGLLRLEKWIHPFVQKAVTKATSK